VLTDPETLVPFTPTAHLDVESCPVCDLTDAVRCPACNAKGVLVVIRRDPPAVDHLTWVLSR
jgi:hypothetical protein